MINVYQIANNLIQTVNRDIPCVWRYSTGYEIENYRQIPQFAEEELMGQVQSSSGDALSLIESMNIQGVARSIYIYGKNVQGIVRSEKRGGDFLIFKQTPEFAEPSTWKVVHVVETWSTNGTNWAHVIGVLQ